MQNNQNKGIMTVVSISVVPMLFMGIVNIICLNLMKKGTMASGLVTIIVLLVTVCCIGLSATFLYGFISVLSNMAKNMGRVAQGDLEFKMIKKSRNESINRIAESMKIMLTNFAKVITGIEEETKNLDALTLKFTDSFKVMVEATDKVADEVTNIADNTTLQARMTEEMVDKTEEMGQAVGNIASKIGELNESAGKMREYNTSSKTIMQELVQISNENGKAVEDIKEQTNVTNQSAQEIREAIEIIAGIATQTNLLALNASIEAARAGEQGKGFAVVAEEIGKLADQSKESSEKISQVVNTLLANSEESVKVTNKVAEAFLFQNEKIHGTDVIFDQLNHEIANVNAAIEEINKEEAGVTKKGIEMQKTVCELRDTVERNAASAEETAAAVEDFTKVVRNCQQSTIEVDIVAKNLINHIESFSNHVTERMNR